MANTWFKEKAEAALQFLCDDFGFQAYSTYREHAVCVGNGVEWFSIQSEDYGTFARLTLFPYPPDEIVPTYGGGINIGYLLEKRKRDPKSKLTYRGESRTSYKGSKKFHKQLLLKSLGDQIDYLGSALKERGKDLVAGDLSALPDFGFVLHHDESELGPDWTDTRGSRFIGVYSSYASVCEAMESRSSKPGFVKTKDGFYVTFELIDGGSWRAGFG